MLYWLRHVHSGVMVYEELVEVMKQGLVEVSGKKGEKRHPWFSRELAKLRKVFHDSEKG